MEYVNKQRRNLLPLSDQLDNRALFNLLCVLFNASSVGEQDDVEGLALETDCLPQYVAKGIALGCFVYGRCLHHGLGVARDREQARYWYSRVCTYLCTYGNVTKNHVLKLISISGDL